MGIDVTARFHHGESFGEREDGCGLVARRVRVAQQPDHETIAKRTRLAEEFDVPEVKQVANRVGIDPAFRAAHANFPQLDMPLWRWASREAIAR